MILLTEFIIFLTSMSSNKMKYLERINDSDEQICNIYFMCIDKFILIESDKVTQVKNEIINRANDNKTNNNKNNIIIDKNKKDLIQLMKEQEQHTINEYSEEINEFTEEKNEIDNNLKEKELVINKNTIKNIAIDASDELFNNNLLLNKIKNENKEKDITIESLKSQINYIQKKDKEKIYKLEENIINLKNNLKHFNETKEKYEQLITKYKKLQYTYENEEKDHGLSKSMKLMQDIDELKEKNEFLIKANDLYALNDKEKIKQLEIENKQLNYENNKNFQKEEIILNINKGGTTLDKILEEDSESHINGSRAKIEEIIFENEHLKSKINKMNQENQKIVQDLQKSEIENKKLLLTVERVENEVKRYINENKCLNDKIIEINKYKKRDIDKLKKELDDKVKIIEKMLKEKKEMIKNYESLQKELLQLKNNNSINNKKRLSSHNNTIKEKEIIISNSETLGLKNEIQNLNLLLLQKDEEIRKLKEERQLTDDEANLKLADLDFYKKLYEEQKFRVNKEHELISESLYKLAMHFMSLKDDLQKKIKNK